MIGKIRSKQDENKIGHFYKYIEIEIWIDRMMKAHHV